MAEHVLGEWKIRTGLRVKVRLAEHGGKSRLDIRQFYMGDEGDWCPSKRGVSIPPEHLSEVMAMLQRAKALLEGKIPDRRNGAGVAAE